MAPQFLDLPRELRDIIYRYYLLQHDGYRYNHESGKLQTTTGPVDLALMHTCTAIAREMHGLALKMNTITFSSACSESARLKADRFHLLMDELARAKRHIFGQTCAPEFHVFRTPEIYARLLQEYPQFVPPDSPDGWPSPFSYGEAGSIHRRFIDHALKLLSTHPDFVETLANHWTARRLRDFVLSPHFFSTPDPWTIAYGNEVAEMIEVVPIPQRSEEERGNEYGDFWKRIKWRWSAAAMCIDFLKSAPPGTRFHIQNIVLLEDRPSVSFPECHALGLIPFCLENPRLHIERRVNLWRNVLPAGSYTSLYRMVHPYTETVGRIQSRIYCDEVSNSFCIWIAEAMALPSAGMPRNSFSLVFDGDPTPRKSYELWQIVKRNAVWQAARDQWCVANHITLPFHEKQNPFLWRFDGFHETVRGITKKISFISCNFPVGAPLDAKKCLADNPDFTLRDWRCTAWYRYSQYLIRTSPPLPDWVDLRLEELLPEE